MPRPDSRDRPAHGIALDGVHHLVDLFGKRSTHAHGQHAQGGPDAEFQRGLSVAYDMARAALLRWSNPM